jgi:hypothetical protein
MANVTRSWTKTLSNPYAPEARGLLSVASLLFLGAAAGLLHVHLRYPLNIPGHHGLEWMALLLFGRLLSSQRHAATLLAAGAAASYLLQSPFLALAHDLKPAMVFLLTGAGTDIAFWFSKGRLPLIVKAGLIGGLVFVCKPAVSYVVFLLADMPVGSFIKHPDYLPFISHFLFGTAGGAGGGLLAQAVILANKK